MAFFFLMLLEEIHFLSLGFPFLATSKSSHVRCRIIIIIIILISWASFTPALADGFSREFEGEHIYSSIQDSSQYSSRT